MDVLKQLEGKLQALVAQRNQLKEEVARLQGEAKVQEEELHGLRRRMEDVQAERDALVKERDDVRVDVANLLKMAEGLD